LNIELKLYGRFIEIFDAEEKVIKIENGANIRDLLNHLCDTDERRMKIFDMEKTNLRPNVVVRKNGRFIVHLNWLGTELEEGDHVEILTLHCGG
jgi:thiamine biosynthesis protein ThiS